jgi:hypothetical protein
MAIIVIEPPEEARVRDAVKVLQEAGINARRMTQPLVKGFVNVRYWEAEDALSLLKASNIQAKLRPG